ncbi:glycosyltransferase family 4 protein [Frankia sp. Cj3]|uniref:glycosyltransferase family 4 protein n=1 Tax=Frankia sp. Cj3 TaxID=2880976 RepID=UPI001EF66B8B|nr:glycosyltransferase family 4 protein [Frankia sp. Cj3]
MPDTRFYETPATVSNMNATKISRTRRPEMIHPQTNSATKIVFIVTIPMSAQILLRGQLADMRNRGYSVTLISSPGPALWATAQREGINAIPVHMERQIAPLADLRALIAITRILRKERPTITKIGTPKAGLLGGLAAVVAGVPCRVYVLHGLRLETATGLKRAVLWSAERVACLSAHRVLCVSPSLLQEARRLRLLPRGKGVLLGSGTSNGINSNHFSATEELLQAASLLRKKFGIPEDAKVIGFVGRLTGDKGIVELLAAHRLLQRSFPGLLLLLVGEPDPDDPLPASVASTLTAPGVIQAGWLTDTAATYHVMDVLALPTYREGFPGVSLEAAAAGRPVVTTSATGAIDSVVDGVTGYIVKPTDSAALADALGRFLADPELAQRMGQNGQKRVRREFDRQAIWDGNDSLFRQLLKERGNNKRGSVKLWRAMGNIRAKIRVNNN